MSRTDRYLVKSFSVVAAFNVVFGLLTALSAVVFGSLAQGLDAGFWFVLAAGFLLLQRMYVRYTIRRAQPTAETASSK